MDLWVFSMEYSYEKVILGSDGDAILIHDGNIVLNNLYNTYFYVVLITFCGNYLNILKIEDKCVLKP